MLQRMNLFVTLLLLGLSACTPPVQTTSSSAPSDMSESSFSPSSTAVALYPSISADSAQPGQNAYSFRQASGNLVNFLLYLPSDRAPEAKWPIIVYLHGYGGIGSKLEIMSDDPLIEILETMEEFPFIVVSPQLPDGLWTSFLDPVDQLLTHLAEIFPVDVERIYLTGFSRGSYGAWQYALRYQGRFAAVAPVAGGPSLSLDRTPENICDLKDLPIWVFHSDADSVVPVDIDVAAVSALELCGGDVKFTRSSDLDHLDTALDAYNNADLYAWFLEHSR
jgi:predicted peptidase